MTNKRTSKSRKGKTNPLYRIPQRVKPPRMSFDGLALNSSFYTGSMTSLLNVASILMPVDCSNFFAAGTAPQQQYGASGDQFVITGRYQTYKYNKLMLHWLPQISPGVTGAGSRLSVAYFDNPEIISALLVNPSSLLIPFVKANRSVKSWNAWESMNYNVPLTNRRKLFDVNTNAVYTADSVDRAVQGLVVVVAESINAAESLGQIKATYTLALHGLSTNTAT